MEIRYVHTNIIAKDWRKLADFYINVFDCSLRPPERDQSGKWLDRGLGIQQAHLQGVHLNLPGYGPEGPTLEIYQYSSVEPKAKSFPNTRGLGHLAFQTGSVSPLLERALAAGASKCGELSGRHIEGIGYLEFIYIYDPEGNLVELQSWSAEPK